MNEHEAIVRELAERGPFCAETVRAGGMDRTFCSMCNFDPDPFGLPDGQGPNINDLDNHEPSCLWRRARELYPEQQGAVGG